MPSKNWQDLGWGEIADVASTLGRWVIWPMAEDRRRAHSSPRFAKRQRIPATVMINRVRLALRESEAWHSEGVGNSRAGDGRGLPVGTDVLAELKGLNVPIDFDAVQARWVQVSQGCGHCRFLAFASATCRA